MEALDSTLTTGEQSGGQEQSKQVSLTGAPHPQSPLQHHQQQETCSQQQHGQCPPKQPKRQCHERKRHRLQQRKNAKDQESPAEEKSSQAEGSSRESREKFPESSSTMSAPSCSMEEANEGTPKQKRERKPQKPGKYVCTYCGRACAKPSVLQKHIRSHTGERPYPCAPCGFSFKTKSNLYKHRKSHTHKVKAGLTSGREEPNIGCQEDPVTDTDDETGQLSSSSCVKKGITTNCTELSSTEQSQGIEHSHAVKKRLAMRLSRGRHAPMGSSDEAASSFGLGSKGSTESGYFSHSESIEISQESPPNSSAKSYAEIILGKYGRLGHLQRATRHQQENPAGQEGKSLAFTVPKKQVIDHITKLITINEAVVDTSKIDSVKPRRFSLSRRSSTETKVSAPKDPLLHCQKELDINSKSSGSITLGVPCEKFQQHSHSLNQQADAASTAPLLRSHSMPAAASETDPSATSSRNLRLSHSFDEPAQNRRHGMLRRQPAIELPIGAEITPEECSTSSLTYRHSIPTVPDHRQKQVEPYECEACGTGCNDWENYKIHKRHLCKEQSSQHPDILSEDPQKTYNTVRPGALAMRKRRKEESLELEDPAVPLASFPSAFDPSQEREKCSGTFEKPTGEFSRSWWEKDKEGGMKGISVIQHTSSFEKQDNPFAKRYEANDTHRDKFSSHDICHLNPQPQSQPQTPKPNYRKLVRQQHVQVPEILVTEDSNTNIVPMSPPPAASSSKDTEKVEEFQWPQRSPTLAQLPIEKLPPKKKRLRLAEAAQSSGESSFESLSLPRSPSQDSSVSHTSSRSASFEEPCKADIDTASMRKSRATHTLTIPTSPHHPHREMRRSASEQAPHIPQKPNPIVETRSKSFDYGSMSPARTPAGWRERRKCLLIRHSAVREPEEDEEPSSPPVHESAPVTKSSISPELSSPSGPTSTSVSLSNKGPLEDHTPQWQLDQSPDNAEVALTTKKCPHSILQLTPLVHSGQHVSFGSPQCPSGAARAHYSPVSTGLKLEILTGDNDEDSASANVPAQNLMNYLHHQHPNLNITPCSELLQPIRMQSIPVRLQSNLTINARSIYTTLSQITFTQLQEPSCSGGGLDLMSPIITLKNQDPTTEGSKLSSQGNKRVLSPSSSVELGSENQQQQKRVKEEGEKESIEHTQGVADVESFNEGRKVDIQSCLQSVVPMGNKEPSFPTLHTKLSCSWCFLNYVKPNPCTQSNYQNSVYSSWCTSLSNPNPLGLTSKEVLSLLQCKQRHSVFTYTMATIPPAMAEPLMPTNASKPSMCEVHPTRLADPTKAEENAELAKRDKSPNEDKEEGEGEAQLTPQYELSRVQVCEGGYRSSEEYVYVRGRGRGRYVCEECGIRCKKPSMLRKHIRLHTDTRPYACQHCNFAFKTKGNLTKHMKSKAHGKKCPGSVSGEADEEGGSVDYAAGAGEHQFSDAEDTEGDEEDEYDYDDEDEDSLSNIPHSSCSKYKCLPKEDPGVQVVSSTAIPDRGQDPSQPRAQSTRKPGNHKRVSSHSSQQTVISPPQITPTSSCCSSPIHSVSPGCNLSPAHPPSSGGELSPLRYPSPRSNLSVSSTQLSLSSSSRPTSPFLDLPLAPIWPASPCSPLPSAGVSNLQRGHRHGDQEKASPNGASSKVKAQKTCSLQGGLHLPQTHLCPPRSLLSRLPRVGHRVLSHLPLHSQQLAPTHSLMIPIGGIQMVQARPTLHHHPPMSPSLAQRSPTVEGRHISVVLDSLFKGWHSKQAVTEGQSLDDASGRPATKFNRKVDSCVSFATKGSISSRDEKIPRDRVLVSSAGSLTHSKMSPTPIQTTKALSDSGEHPSRILCEAIPTTRSSKLNSQEEVHQETVPMANLAKLEK